MAIKIIYQTGLQGAQGTQGAVGPQGPEGPPGSGGTETFEWVTADGFVKSVAHNFDSYNLSFTFVDLDNGEFFEVGDIISTSSNVTEFYANELPSAAGWRIIIRN